MAISYIGLGSYLSTGTGRTGYTTSAVDTTNADLLVLVGFAYYGFYSELWNGTYITDSASNTWSFLSIGHPTNDTFQSAIAYCVNPSKSATHTASLASNSVNNYSSLVLLAFSGVVQTSPLDTNTQALSLTPGSITPAQAGELFISALTGNASTPSLGGNFTDIFIAANAANNTACGLAYYINLGTSAVNPTWTCAGSTDNDSKLIAFKPAAASATALPRRALDGPFYGSLKGSVR